MENYLVDMSLIFKISLISFNLLSFYSSFYLSYCAYNSLTPRILRPVFYLWVCLLIEHYLLIFKSAYLRPKFIFQLDRENLNFFNLSLCYIFSYDYSLKICLIIGIEFSMIILLNSILSFFEKLVEILGCYWAKKVKMRTIIEWAPFEY